MSYFAQINENNVVVQVIISEITDGSTPNITIPNGHRWIETFENGSARKRLAGVGMTYDEERDAFLTKQPFSSWTLNETTLEWEAPVAKPGEDWFWDWNEEQLNWIDVRPT